LKETVLCGLLAALLGVATIQPETVQHRQITAVVGIRG